MGMLKYIKKAYDEELNKIDVEHLEVFHVSSHKEYKQLMSYFDMYEFRWFGVYKPFEIDVFKKYKKDTCIIVNHQTLSYCSLEQAKIKGYNIGIWEG